MCRLYRNDCKSTRTNEILHELTLEFIFLDLFLIVFDRAFKMLISFSCIIFLKNSQCFQTLNSFDRGLAQLVELLAHRYSESMSLNPGNLTSATVCGDRTSCVLAAKR